MYTAPAQETISIPTVIIDIIKTMYGLYFPNLSHPLLQLIDTDVSRFLQGLAPLLADAITFGCPVCEHMCTSLKMIHKDAGISQKLTLSVSFLSAKWFNPNRLCSKLKLKHFFRETIMNHYTPLFGNFSKFTAVFAYFDKKCHV